MPRFAGIRTRNEDAIIRRIGVEHIRTRGYVRFAGRVFRDGLAIYIWCRRAQRQGWPDDVIFFNGWRR